MPKYVKDKTKRINIKSKRRRNLLKKAIEIKRMCGLQMFIVLQDTEFNKVFVYNSAKHLFHKQYLNSLVDDRSNPKKYVNDAKTTFIRDEDFHLLKVDKDPLGIKEETKKQRTKKEKVYPEESEDIKAPDSGQKTIASEMKEKTN